MLYTRSKQVNDEWNTPDYAIIPLLKYLKPNSKIWCPFDTEESNYLKILRNFGHIVYNTHIHNIKNTIREDFFNLSQLEFWYKQFDYIISNPPFSIKTKVLQRLYELKIPFAMLLPIPSLDSIKRHKLFKENGLELLIFNHRINFNNLNRPTFNSSYFCWNILPKQLIFENIEKDK